MNEPSVIEEMLRKSKIIAVVGMSDKSTRASHHIGKYLADKGYHVLPVNPVLTSIDGKACYADLDAAQAAAKEQTGAGIDLVDVFRASEHVPAIVKDVMRLHIPYLWLQDGVTHDEAIGWAEGVGVKCVQNDCIFRRHAAMRGY
jgi:predicted CoA-binding protein